ncbi:MAG TPA: MFS transporter, partial [Rhodopila sp.]|uniref:MFS transporter n=1 Tax=Rhodopila sp. TaxID=2480087 RepID=UPI002C0577FE
MPAFRLILSRRLWPLTLAQAGGALNDNLVKNAMLVLALFRLHVGGAGLSALAGALFIVPYVLLSATAGKLADRYPKPRLTLIYKLAECGLMAGAAAAFLTASVPALLALLFGLGCQAALFGPVKYGVLPEYLHPEELIAGNGLIEATTFCAIVLGTVAGGGLILLPAGAAIVGVAGLALAAAGLAGAWLMPRLPAADASLRVGFNLLAETVAVLRASRRVPAIWSSVLCLSWFWTMGATVLTELPVLVRDQMRAEGSVLTLLLAVFAIGVGIGSLGCARLLHGRISTRLAPVAGAGISLFCWDFGGAHAAGLATVPAVLASVQGWRMLADLGLLAACGGVFSVPFYAVIQDRSAPAERSRMVAANNIMNALFMV